MHVCTYATNVHMCTCAHIQQTCTYAHMPQMCTCAHVHIYNKHAHMHICNICMQQAIFVVTRVHIHIHIQHTCAHTYTHRHTHTNMYTCNRASSRPSVNHKTEALHMALAYDYYGACPRYGRVRSENWGMVSIFDRLVVNLCVCVCVCVCVCLYMPRTWSG